MSSVADEILLTRVANSPFVTARNFRIKTFESLNDNLNTPIAVLEIPEGGAAKSVLTKFSGNTRRITLRFIIAMGANGIPSCAVDEVTSITAPRDLYYDLKTNFESKSIFHSYTIKTVTAGTSIAVNPINHSGSIESIQGQASRDDPLNWDVTIIFVEGESLTNLVFGT